MEIKKKLIFYTLFLSILLPLVLAYNYSEGNYSNSFYGTGYYIAPEDNTGSQVSEETQTTTSGGSYVSQTYFTNEIFPTQGNNFNLRYNDKIRFIIQRKDHILTMNNFNSTTAKVKIESNPIIVYLQKETLYEFDLNNDSAKDVRIRYDGINKTKAMIFIQEIIYPSKESEITEDEVDDSQGGKSTKDNKYLNLVIIIILIIGIVLLLIFYKHHRKRRYHLFGY